MVDDGGSRREIKGELQEGGRRRRRRRDEKGNIKVVVKAWEGVSKV